VCVCVWFYYTPNQLGGQRSPLSYNNEGIYVPSTQLNYSPKRNLKPQMRYLKARRNRKKRYQGVRSAASGGEGRSR